MSAPRRDLAGGLALGLSLAAAAALVTLRWLEPDHVHLIWADRALARALDVVRGTPVDAAAELSYGGGARIPGGFLYELLALPLAATDAARAVYRFALLLEVLALGLLAWGVARRHGRLAAGLAVGLAVAADPATDSLRQLWNPAYTPLWSTVVLLASARTAQERDARHLPAAALAVALGTQLHLAVALAGLPMILAALVCRPRGLLRHGALSLLLVGAAYAPYLAADAAEGWANTRLLQEPSHVADLDVIRDPGGWNAQNLWGLAEAARDGRNLVRLVDALRLGPGAHGLAWLGVLSGLAAVAGAAGALRRREDRDLRVALAGVVAVAGYLVMARTVRMNEATLRYLLPATPGLAWLGAVGIVRLRDGLVGRAGGLAGLLPVGLALLVGARAAGAALSLGQELTPIELAGSRARLLADLEDFAAAPLVEVAPRTLVLRASGSGRWRWLAADGVAYELARAGHEAPPARGGPCLAV
ncbi:MAG: hypothetical protein H6732_12715, partial [Alphaproteobacteria bacterium]|nr:hypothetical protein [Alphaproteobacteria bacterium]